MSSSRTSKPSSGSTAETQTDFSSSCPGTWGTWRTKDWPASSGRATTARPSGRCRSFSKQSTRFRGALNPFLKAQPKTGPHAERLAGVQRGAEAVRGECRAIPLPCRQGAGAVGADAGHQRRSRQAGGAVRPAGRGQPRSGWAGRSALQARGAPDRDLREGVRHQIQRRLERPRHHPAPARPPTRPGRISLNRTSRSRYKSGGSSARSATSGARPAGSPSASPVPSCATSKGWSSWWTARRSRPTTGA